MRYRLLAFAGCACLTAAASAQEAAFEVASIRPSRGNQAGQSGAQIRTLPSGRFTATNVTTRSLILRAYGLVESQVVGGPAWVDAERFDIDARADAPAGGPESLLPLVRALLAERFGLEAHLETRELPAYALTLARRDGRLGPGIRQTEADCGKASTITEDEMRAAARDGWPPCGMFYLVTFVTSESGGTAVKMRTRRSGVTMQALATALQPTVDRPVVDQTALGGRFDVEYSFSPRQPTTTAGAAGAPEAPNLFVALEEDLGLKLESRRMAVPVLVIDAIHRPTAN